MNGMIAIESNAFLSNGMESNRFKGQNIVSGHNNTAEMVSTKFSVGHVTVYDSSVTDLGGGQLLF